MCSQEQIEKALLELADGRYEQRAKEVSRKIRMENGYKTAADWIERNL